MTEVSVESVGSTCSPHELAQRLAEALAEVEHVRQVSDDMRAMLLTSERRRAEAQARVDELESLLIEARQAAESLRAESDAQSVRVASEHARLRSEAEARIVAVQRASDAGQRQIREQYESLRVLRAVRVPRRIYARLRRFGAAQASD